MNAFPAISLSLPGWVEELCSPRQRFPTRIERMDLALALARTNFERGTGGPFGVAVFDDDGHLIAPGVNLVVSHNFAGAHAEIVAIGVAGQVVSNFDLGESPTELVTSTEPCAMCMGAVPWSGVARLVCGARHEDAAAIGFEEGDKPDNWVGCLEARGIEVIRDVARTRAIAVLNDYAAAGGVIYNGRIGNR